MKISSHVEKREPLFELAERGDLPRHQFIDGPTVRWIESNRPRFGVTKKMQLPTREDVERFIPSDNWFVDKKLVDSIHGLRHIIRVIALSALVASKYSYSGRIENLLAAAALHDIRRENDKGDSKHGLHSAQWFRKNIAVVESRFNIKLARKDIQSIYWTIALHELPVNALIKSKNYARFKKGVDIIRIADALDRYRLPKIKWWLNEKIIGCRVASGLKQVAFDLVVKSERRYLKGRSGAQSVLENFI